MHSELTKPVKVSGRFGICRNDGYGVIMRWHVAEIIGPTGLWIEHPEAHADEESARKSAMWWAERDKKFDPPQPVSYKGVVSREGYDLLSPAFALQSDAAAWCEDAGKEPGAKETKVVELKGVTPDVEKR